MKPTVLLDRVIDGGTYTSLDFEKVNQLIKEKYDFWGGGCTAVAKTIENGDTIVGRNLDLFISDKPAYICRTKVEGEYETIGVSYTNMSGTSYADVLENGISEEMKLCLPYLCIDVLNEKGLYCEVNMRTGEYYPDGTLKYVCDGTNPKAEIRTVAFIIPRLVCQKCATVKEAVEYLKTIDFYTPKAPGFTWNFCFQLADANGDYGVVEIADNEISFLPQHPAHTNFYITQKFADKEEYKIGLGRYEVVMEGVEAVNSEEDMFELIDKVTYYQSYFPEKCKYDPRSENITLKPYWTTDYVLAEANREEIFAKINENKNLLNSMTREEIEATGKYWQTVFTTVANCNKKTMRVRFFEDDSRVLDLTF
ncbi:MAG: linear amide C-N hydrolase [Lachnospiraceae bacterium]|nr:linear amide C-N hydrolase [Lachnospiraceae bacterium]